MTTIIPWLFLFGLAMFFAGQMWNGNSNDFGGYSSFHSYRPYRSNRRRGFSFFDFDRDDWW